MQYLILLLWILVPLVLLSIAMGIWALNRTITSASNEIIKGLEAIHDRTR